MKNSGKRKVLTPGNKYQTQIILLAFFPTLVICFFLVFLVLGLQTGVIRRADLYNRFVIVAFSALFTLALLRVFVLSRNLLGAFGRIIHEMDEILAGRSKKLLSARPYDEFATVLLQRINVFIQAYLDSKK